MPEIFYYVCNVDTRHPTLYYVTSVDYVLNSKCDRLLVCSA